MLFYFFFLPVLLLAAAAVLAALHAFRSDGYGHWASPPRSHSYEVRGVSLR